MATKVVYQCDICKEETHKSEMCKVEVGMKMVESSLWSNNIKVEVCLSCVKKYNANIKLALNINLYSELKGDV